MLRLLRDPRASKSGQVLVLFALSLVVLLSALAVILDGGRVYAERRKAQNAADAAAMAGAAVLNKANPAGTKGAVLAAACTAAFQNGGFGNATGTADNVLCGTKGSVVNVHIPVADAPPSLTNVYPVFENPGYVQVAVKSSFRSFMSGLLGLSDFSASALGVAVNIPGNGLGDVLLVLNPTDCASLVFNGSNTLNVSGGDVMVDSNAAKTSGPVCVNKNAVTQSGGGSINNTTGQNNVVGLADANSHLSPAFTTGVPYKPDPLTRVRVPPFDSTYASPAGTGTPNVPKPWTAMGTAGASAGVYWGGITVTNGDKLTLSGGTYIMAGGGFNVQGGEVSAGTSGVTLIYTMDPYCNSAVASPPPGCNAPAQKAGNLDGSHLNGSSSAVGQQTGSWGTSTSALRPQTLNPDPNSLSSILIYVDRNALAQDSSTVPCPATTITVGGNGYFNFATGSIIYAPCGNVNLHGTSDPPSHGGALVAWQVVINGTKDMDLGGPPVGGGPTAQSNLVQ